MLEITENIRIVILEVRMSFGSVVEQFAEKHLTFDEILDLKNPGTFILKASGHSMSPRILDGDLLIVHRAAQVVSGAIIVALINNQFTVRRFYQRSNHVILSADNKKFPDIIVNDNSRFEIWGIVSFILGKV